MRRVGLLSKRKEGLGGLRLLRVSENADQQRG